MSAPRPRGALAAGARVAADEVRVTEVLVVGGGVAGLATALGCAPRAVTLVTKTRLGEGGSSAWAQGGVAVAVGDDDAPEIHAADTLAVAGGLADAGAVDLLTREGPRRIAALLRLGTRFDRDGGGPGLAGLARGREAAHSRRRILHAGGDATGAELMRALTAAVRRAPGVRADEETFALDLLVDPASRRVTGVLALGADGGRVLYLAGAVVLATGGLGQIYRFTTNPPEVTGDGLAMAARAGARLADLEFFQFHPTALAVGDGGERLPLLTEALRGDGAVLVDGAGRRFMPAEHPLAELAPRDVVARAIHRRRTAGDEVFLDARAVAGAGFAARFPTVFAAARAAGLDPRRDLLPVVPAAHYHMGGVATDDHGRTSLAGLWACGETAATGVHGANRLASNSLLEALVFGARVADDLARRPTPVPGSGAADRARLRVCGAGFGPAPEAEGGDEGRMRMPVTDRGGAGPAVAGLRRRLRELMWDGVGLVRDGVSLARARAGLLRLEAEAAALPAGAVLRGPADRWAGLETRNLLTVAGLVAMAAEARTESRGAHHRTDHPAADPAWRRRLLVTMDPTGRPALELGDPVGDDEEARPARTGRRAGAR